MFNAFKTYAWLANFLLLTSLLLSNQTWAANEHLLSDLQPAPAALPSDTAQATPIYMCPMHQHIKQDKPGVCPICGMDLQLSKSTISTSELGIELSGELQQSLAIKIEPVEIGPLWRYFATTAEVNYNGDNTHHFHSRVSGWIQQTDLTSAQMQVKAGQVLYTVYSPELQVAQNDLLNVIDVTGNNPKQAEHKRLLSKAKQRLTLLGVSPRVINQVIKEKQTLTYVPFYASHDGIVIKTMLAHGMYIEPATQLLSIADQSSYWLSINIPQSRRDWFTLGTEFDVSAFGQAQTLVSGSIDYFYPDLHVANQTHIARSTIQASTLKVGQKVKVALYGGRVNEQLHINRHALLSFADTTNRVVVKNKAGQFVIRPVKVSLLTQERAAISQGLEAGELVVTSGQFLFDSEASLQQSINQLNSNQAVEHDARHQHH
ncbi:hypothetical protein C2869_21245 [Saccharobesus litoralis]|uniref:Uncharacterized protein n=1 Tax=Saccharobesus litoralis TaxID=2172099 RepID=A0A2S0VX10_9ALTE|nr:efflux RND transporter periplasmic adaptor subunit [Saccharobesus litoralis]AWB68767.1 hypothetical protein C2869_21245 [Saccharobesus litoralis]